MTLVGWDCSRNSPLDPYAPFYPLRVTFHLWIDAGVRSVIPWENPATFVQPHKCKTIIHPHIAVNRSWRSFCEESMSLEALVAWGRSHGRRKISDGIPHAMDTRCLEPVSRLLRCGD